MFINHNQSGWSWSFIVDHSFWACTTVTCPRFLVPPTISIINHQIANHHSQSITYLRVFTIKHQFIHRFTNHQPSQRSTCFKCLYWHSGRAGKIAWWISATVNQPKATINQVCLFFSMVNDYDDKWAGLWWFDSSWPFTRIHQGFWVSGAAGQRIQGWGRNFQVPPPGKLIVTQAMEGKSQPSSQAANPAIRRKSVNKQVRIITNDY